MAGPTACRSSPRLATRTTAACARASRCRRAATLFREDSRLSWHPAAAPLAALHAEGKVTVLPAVGYDHPDQSHFVSRHFWEVGALDPGLRSGWLGRLLDSIGSPDNPLQGVSMGGSLGPSLATSRVPVAAVDAPEDFGFWMPGAWGPPADLALTGVLGCRPRPQGVARPGGGPGRPRRRVRRRRAQRAGAARQRRRADLHAARRLPAEPGALPAAGSPGWRRCSAPGYRSAAPRSTPPGAWDTHADQADDPHRQPADHRRQPVRVPARPRGARARRPRARRSCGRSSAAAPRRTARAPTTARPGSAS